MNKYKKLFSDVGLFAVSNFGSKVLIFLMVPLYTNMLTTYEYGVIDLIHATINLLFPVLSIAISEATLRFAMDKKYKQGSVLWFSSVVIMVGFLLVLCSEKLVTVFISGLDGYWGYFAALYITMAFNHCLSNYARGIDKTKVFAVKGILYTLSLVVLNVIFLVVFKAGLIGYLVASIIAEIITITYILLAGGIKLHKADMKIESELVREMVRYSLPMIPTIVSWWIVQASDKFVVIHFMGLEASGIYGMAYKIPTILSMLTTIFTQAWQISAIKSVSDDNNDEFVSSIYNYFLFFSLIACALIIPLCKGLGQLLYANEYFVAWTYVPILLLAYVFSGLSGVLASVFSAQKKTNVLFHSTTVGAVVNIVLNFLLVPRYGAISAAYSTLIAFFLTWTVRMVSVKKIVSLQSNDLKDLLAIGVVLIEAVVMSSDMWYKYIVCLIAVGVCVILYRLEFVAVLKILIKFFTRRR